MTLASVVTVLPAEVEMSPENAGSRAPERVPELIWDALILLFVKVCVSLVPTIAPAGALTAEVVLTPVRTTMPFDPGSPSPAGELVDWTTQVFTAVQAYKFFPATASVLKNRSPGEQVAGRAVPVFRGRVKGALVKSIFLPWVARLICVVCPYEARAMATGSQTIRSAAFRLEFLITFM